MDPAPTDTADSTADWQLRRWQIMFCSGKEWFAVGEFLAVDGASAIARAVEIFGSADQYQAERISWEAAPLSPGK
jgi:hypothetical protein